MTITLGWQAMAVLLVWSAIMFALGRAFGGGRPTDPTAPDLSGRAFGAPRGSPSSRRTSSHSSSLPSSAPVITTAPRALTSDEIDRVATILRNQGKIAAIKAVRDLSGTGLAEAKHVVDGMEG